MERITRFLVPATVVFIASCWFFAVQPWMDAVTGWRKWLLTIERAGELLALYALTHGLIVWADTDKKRWSRITTGCIVTGVALLFHALASYRAWNTQFYSPLLPAYITQWARAPYIWRIGLALLVLAAGGIRTITKKNRSLLIVTVAVLALYRLAPELHIFFFPSEGAIP